MLHLPTLFKELETNTAKGIKQCFSILHFNLTSSYFDLYSTILSTKHFLELVRVCINLFHIMSLQGLIPVRSIDFLHCSYSFCVQ